MFRVEKPIARPVRAPDAPGLGVDAYIGARMRLRRRVLGMSQEALAQAVGVTLDEVLAYERGCGQLAGSTLFEIARVLRMPIDYFYDGLIDMPARRARELLA